MSGLSAQPILVVDRVSKVFGATRGLLARLTEAVTALEDVSFTVAAGRTLAIVGESGSGKSTLGRCIAGILETTSGQISYRGRACSKSAYLRDSALRRSVQMIFQDPGSSLNPRLTVGDILAEPLAVHRLVPRARIRDRVAELLDAVGLPAQAAGRMPHAFSGGQKQRIAIARSLSLEPDVLICDEAVSALDVSIQAQIINLLKDLQEKRGLTYLFISHDMAVVRHIADDVVVLKGGRMEEAGALEQVLAHPTSAYTRALLNAVPRGIARHRMGTP